MFRTERIRAMSGQRNQWRINNLYLVFLLLFFRAPFICAAGHQLCFTFGCFDSSDTQLYITLDDDELVYADFKKSTAVWESKIPTTLRSDSAYKYAEACQIACNKDIYRWKADPDVRRTEDAPEMIIYPRSEVIKDEENTLVCFINNFFPPAVNIRWTKNEKEVMVEDPFIKTISNSDGRFHVFSYLNFVPKQGDIYSCSVEHEALEEPKTKIWDVGIEEKHMGPVVFYVIGLTLGFLGIAAGTFLFVKGSQYCDRPHFAG
ncbi:H-2 class II histocompatibility antigen, A-U alpha chain-like isoform X2 [Girardinichthys multiradiatus]|uniref:H-2 class II histocompatibility antigen, A-U alpha chain-like isoform X2 n=1 Tax=Girardinichthys multiradiatus TaxID=208333 RepID=UPI001FAC7C00|nr:H-2 class II histocompatibility antigen, A-U alpha chain-like isoform X2 [Girardinichthys multiradiatus]